MSYIYGWKKAFLFFLFFTSLMLILPRVDVSAVTFGPKICDVTPKQFSVVWTQSSSYNSCGIRLYTDATYSTVKSLEEGQLIVETYDGHQGKTNRIAKVTVVDLNPNKTYYFRRVVNSIAISPNMQVKTENLRGLYYADSGGTDIVSNDIVHKAIYKPDGVSPGLGVLVLADILEPADSRSDHPVSAWVGEGMIGDEATTQYENPNDISYKQYAALDLNNLFRKSDNFPLSLHGDDPSTETVDEAEKIRFTIVCGDQDILGKPATDPNDWIVDYGRVDFVDKIDDVKITTAKVSASFKFKKGANAFALPFSINDELTTGELLQAIEEKEGIVGIVESIWSYPVVNPPKYRDWVETYQDAYLISPGNYYKVLNNSVTLPVGEGCFITMKQDMTKELTFYGNADSVKINLYSGVTNMIALPQTPLFFKTTNLLKDIETRSGAGDLTVERIWSFVNNDWVETYQDAYLISPGNYYKILNNPAPMSSTNCCIVILKSGSNDVVEWDPFDVQ